MARGPILRSHGDSRYTKKILCDSESDCVYIHPKNGVGRDSSFMVIGLNLDRVLCTGPIPVFVQSTNKNGCKGREKGPLGVQVIRVIGF